MLLFERGAVFPVIRSRIRRLPMIPGVVLTEIAYLGMICLGGGVAGVVVEVTGLVVEPWANALFFAPVTLLYALVVSGVIITVDRARELIGTEMFRDILLGRYHHPVEEERIFLFLDLIGSTDYAQRHGDLRAQAFLSAIFAALADPVRRHRGAIDDYVGDMAMVTWPLATGVAQARCVACVFAFFDDVARDGERWRREFGQVPRFRAALHGGQVVTAEVGSDKHKIAYFGDVVNTTGRLEGLCRQLDAPVLVSADLMDVLPGLPPGVVVRPLGAHGLKGRGQSLRVFALDSDVHGEATAPEANRRTA